MDSRGVDAKYAGHCRTGPYSLARFESKSETYVVMRIYYIHSEHNTHPSSTSEEIVPDMSINCSCMFMLRCVFISMVCHSHSCMVVGIGNLHF